MKEFFDMDFQNGKYYKLALIAAIILLVCNGFALSEVFREDPEATAPVASDSQTHQADAAVSGTDYVVSAGDAAVSGADVSHSDVKERPPIVLTALDGAAAQRLDGIAAEYNCVGMSAAVIIDGKLAYNYEYGYADRRMTREVDINTKFRIASLSKVMTSTLGMKLAEEGKLDLDCNISDILGRKAFNPNYTSTPITMRMLLTHTSSYRDKSPIFATTLKSDLINEKSYLNRKPGTYFNYSNLGMGIAGAAVEKASGKTISEYADEVFFSSMGIDAAYNGALLEDKVNIAECVYVGNVTHDVESLTSPRGDKVPGENHSVGAGALIISAVDYAKFMTVLLNGGVYENQQYLSAQTVEQIHTPQYTCEGFEQCIGVRKTTGVIGDRTVYYHTGAAEGIFSMMLYDPADRTGVVILSTGASDYYYDNGMRHICLNTIQALYEDVIDPYFSAQ